MILINKNIIFIIFLYLYIFLFISCGEITLNSIKEDYNEIKIGFMGPMSGPNGLYGTLMFQSVEMAVEKFNKGGGIHGHKVVVVSGDTQGNADLGKKVAQKLIKENIVGLLGPAFSSVAVEVIKDFDNAQIPMISGSATGPVLTSMSRYMFRTVPNDTLQSEVMALFMREILIFDSLGILYTQNVYSRVFSDSLIKYYTEAGGKVIAVESAKEGDEDFTLQLLKIKEASPGAIFLPNYVPEIAKILKQKESLDMDMDVLAGDGFSSPEIFSRIGDLANGVIFSASPELDSPVRQDFVNQYLERYGSIPDNYSENIYDAAFILLRALSLSYDPEIQEVDMVKATDIIARTNSYQGITGDITFDEMGDVIKPIAIKTVVNQAFQQNGVYKVWDGKLIRLDEEVF